VTSEVTSTKVDIVVGLITYNDAETIGGVATAVCKGLSRFEGVAPRIIWADGGSTDDTPGRAREALAGGDLVEMLSPPSTADLLALPYHGIPGKARQLHDILTAARTLEARACVIMDAGVSTVAPQWLEWFVLPVLEHGFDLVAPYFHRPPHEGALTKGIVYPLFRALYGLRLRQPAAREFACSPRFIERCLDDDLWGREGAQVGIDLWLTASAASRDLRVGEASLGVRTHHARDEDALDLEATLTQVVGSLFADLERRVERWQRVRGALSVQQFGDPSSVAATRELTVNVERLIESYRLGYRELRDIWTWVLPPKTIVDLHRLVKGTSADFRLDDDLWARIVYDFALGYRLRVLARDHLLRSLVPLYLGWLASFISQVRDLSTEAVDERVERLAAAFEAQKPYLIARWRWPERIRT
jgi:hypothetical protein